MVAKRKILLYTLTGSTSEQKDMFGVLSLGFGACCVVSDYRGCFRWNLNHLCLHFVSKCEKQN